MKMETVHTPAMIVEMFEVIHNALLVIDSNYRIIFANNRTAKMFNIAPGTLVGKSFATLFMPEDIDILVQNILSITRTKPETESEAMFLKGDGNTFLGRISGTCFEWAENHEGMVFSIYDISEMKEIEQSLKSSERIVLLGRLVDDISHQVRNPIMAIGGFARRLKSKYGSSRNVEIILNEASRLEKLLNTMNRFSRLPQPIPQKIQFRDLIKELATVVGVKMQERGCIWSCSCDDQLLDEKLLIDQNLFLEAVIDVAENSCESYLAQHSDNEHRVQCEISRSGNDIFPFILNITDFGPGMAGDVREHVFSHFYTDKTGHIGMGLTFARRIIEEQGGKMTIESKPGQGTTVNFHLIKERRRALRTNRIS